jgi:hypothetical protein
MRLESIWNKKQQRRQQGIGSIGPGGQQASGSARASRGSDRSDQGASRGRRRRTGQAPARAGGEASRGRSCGLRRGRVVRPDGDRAGSGGRTGRTSQGGRTGRTSHVLVKRRGEKSSGQFGNRRQRPGRDGGCDEERREAKPIAMIPC